MQVIITSLQADNHASTTSLSFCRPDVLHAAQQPRQSTADMRHKSHTNQQTLPFNSTFLWQWQTCSLVCERLTVSRPTLRRGFKKALVMDVTGTPSNLQAFCATVHSAHQSQYHYQCSVMILRSQHQHIYHWRSVHSLTRSRPQPSLQNAFQEHSLNEATTKPNKILLSGNSIMAKI